jgi:hypothetical protein
MVKLILAVLGFFWLLGFSEFVKSYHTLRKEQIERPTTWIQKAHTMPVYTLSLYQKDGKRVNHMVWGVYSSAEVKEWRYGSGSCYIGSLRRIIPDKYNEVTIDCVSRVTGEKKSFKQYCDYRKTGSDEASIKFAGYTVAATCSKNDFTNYSTPYIGRGSVLIW